MSSKKYTKETKEDAIRMYKEHRSEYLSNWKAMVSIALKLGMTPETLRVWVKQDEINSGKRQGVTTFELEETKKLKKENAELKRANEILKAASIFFATELNGH